MKKRRPPIERWEEKVERTESCWLWRGAIKETGYGVMQRGGRGEGIIRAHRFAYEHFKGEIPSHLEIRHVCHVRHCVNPDHLVLGTRTDNMRDMVEAGRYNHNRRLPRGEDNAKAKLTEAVVRAIRADGRTLTAIAAELGVSISCVWCVRHRHTWCHVD